MATPFYQVSGDAQRALEQFSLEYTDAFAAAPADDWTTLGSRVSSNAIKTTYPCPVSAAGYVERKGDDKLRSLFERSLTMKNKEYVDGVAEKAMILRAPDFTGWGSEPSRIALEAKRHPCTLVAAMLEANPQLSFYQDEALGSTDFALGLFGATHPVNVFDTSLGTFDNDLTASAFDQDLFETLFTEFATRKGANGKPMRLKPTHVLCHASDYQTARKFLESDMMRAAFLEGGDGSTKNTNQISNNIWRGAVVPVLCHELTTAGTFYFLDATAGAKPWIVQDGGAPEEIVYDTNSDLYKSQGKLGVKYVLQMGVAPALPHAIVRVVI